MTTEIAEEQSQVVKENPNRDDSEKQLHELLLPNVNDLPINPISAIQFNFVTYFAPGDSDPRKCEETEKKIVIMNKGMDSNDEQHGVDPSVFITEEEMGKVSKQHHLPSIFMGEQPYSEDYPQTPKVITN
uniref:Uncharacterized protein n=1 Tax=Tanacetum cinerariifolium TaxID=118510 RepID=A0A6L2LBW7_TANCI|nr:hypothetical protein [Tanacetum cinerariifolium]